MGNYNEKSILKTKLIRKVLLNQKNYKFQDFKFKVKKDKVISENKYWKHTENHIEVYDFDKLILKLRYKEDNQIKEPERYEVKVIYFDPQTNNDCQSINHIIAVLSELCEEKHCDRGNASVISNQYVFRKKDNFYSYTNVWTKGEIKNDNYNKELSHEFATEEYINNIKKIFGFKRMPRRDLKKRIINEIQNAIDHENKKLLVQSLEEK